MTKTIDHYEYWNKNRKEKTRILDREQKCLRIINEISKDSESFLDLGCGNGDFLDLVKRNFPSLKLEGLDYSTREVEEAKKRGFKVKRANFEESLGIKGKSIDIAYAAEIIEHLYNPDKFLQEINKSMKKGGYLLITTPNLLAWFNRILFFFGIQPLFLEMSTKSKLVGAGMLKKLKKEPTPVGHVRIFTIDALKDIFRMYGFKIISIKGAIYDEGLPKTLWPLDRVLSKFPSISSNLIVLARKEREI